MGGSGATWAGMGCPDGARDRLQRDQNIVWFSDEQGASLEQLVGAFGARIEGVPGDGEHFAPVLARQACGDERAGSARRFHHEDAE